MAHGLVRRSSKHLGEGLVVTRAVCVTKVQTGGFRWAELRSVKHTLVQVGNHTQKQRQSKPEEGERRKSNTRFLNPVNATEHTEKQGTTGSRKTKQKTMSGITSERALEDVPRIHVKRTCMSHQFSAPCRLQTCLCQSIYISSPYIALHKTATNTRLGR